MAEMDDFELGAVLESVIGRATATPTVERQDDGRVIVHAELPPLPGHYRYRAVHLEGRRDMDLIAWLRTAARKRAELLSRTQRRGATRA